MQEMLQALAVHRETLPDSVKALLMEQEEAQAASRAREMHRQVATQHTKTKKLTNLRAQREQYVKQWASYMETLSDTLQTQLKEKEATLQKFAENEAALLEDITGARAAVLQPAGGERVSSDALMDDEEPTIWIPPETEKQQQTEVRLLELMRQSTLAAARAAHSGRDSSRTPRRERKEPCGKGRGHGDTHHPARDQDPEELAHGLTQGGRQAKHSSGCKVTCAGFNLSPLPSRSGPNGRGAATPSLLSLLSMSLSVCEQTDFV